MMLNKSLLRLVFSICICLIITSCTSDESTFQISSFENDEVTLKIAVPNNNFEKTYRTIIEKRYPKLTLEFIKDGYNKAADTGEWNEWLEVHQPDLIVSYSPRMFSKLIRDGLLLPLDSLIQRDNVDLNLYVPGVIEWLRLQDENRQLYGMATEYYTMVLLYNTKHFDRLGISYPSEKITWSELLQLAERFQDDPVYGLYIESMTPSRIILDIGRTEELRLYNLETGEVFSKTKEWKGIWEQVLQTYKTGELVFNHLPADVAMILQFTFFNPENTFGNLDEGWKMTYYPVKAENPHESHVLQVHRPISIYNQSLQNEYAWELLKFIISEDMSRFGGSPKFGMPNHMKTVTHYTFENAHVLYDIKPKVDSIPEFDRFEYGVDLYDIGDRIFEDVSKGSITLDEGLEQFEAELKILVEKARVVNPNSNKE